MMAGELTGDLDQAIYWFRNELVADGHADAVLADLSELIDGENG